MKKYNELISNGWIDTKIGYAFDCVFLEKDNERMIFDLKKDKIVLQYMKEKKD